MHEHTDTLVAVCVGNTRARVGLFRDGTLEESTSAASAEPVQVTELVRSLDAHSRGVILLASVNDPAADAIAELIESASGSGAGRAIRRVGRDFDPGIRADLHEGAKAGQDRLLCALGAWSRAEEACVVIDAGTAVTVDYVDAEGVFRGGAIAPGLNMALRALHEHTAALPLLRYEPAGLPLGPFGRSTTEAMLEGARAGIVGLVHLLIDRYAIHAGAYPRVIATGGDAQTLFAGDELVEHIVPDLQLVGLVAAWRMAVTRARDEASSGGAE